MKLYKFRPLATCQDLDRARQILETGKFWCSHFWELNDPMEGVYQFNVGALAEEDVREFYSKKTSQVICSFSGEKAFQEPIMWGYYANGFKGIAIEIEVDEARVTTIEYTSEIPNITGRDLTDNAVKRILTTKLSCWAHEDEYRYLYNPHGDDSGPLKIGRITAVYFGNPYKAIDNHEDIQSLPGIREYLCRAESLRRTAKDIPCHEVRVVKGLVKKYKRSLVPCPPNPVPVAARLPRSVRALVARQPS
jgi:hypothetical protein